MERKSESMSRQKTNNYTLMEWLIKMVEYTDAGLREYQTRKRLGLSKIIRL